MANRWSSLKKRIFLDVGTSTIRLCELVRTKSGYEVAKYVHREYNSDPSLEEVHRNELRTRTLQEVLKEAKVRKREVILSVAGQSVFTRCRTLPPVPEYRVSQIVRYEIQQQIPFGLDQIAMDYQILGQTEQGGFDVMMAAIKVDVVEKCLEVLKPLKLSVAAVDVAPIAAYNWLKHQREFGEHGDCVALIEIGASTTDIVIERGNQFRFTRPLNIGGNDITKAIAEAFNMDFISAEKIKRERCFAPTGDPKRDGRAGEVVGNVLQRLSGEIIRSFSYFRSLPGGGQVNRVILTGGGARLKNLVPYLKNSLGMDVRIAQPLNNITIGKDAQAIKEYADQACIVLGTALRRYEKVVIDINLIPPRIVEVARYKQQALYWGLSVCALVLIFASIVPSAANQNKIVKERIEELKRGIRAYDPELVQRIRPGSPVPPSELKSQLEMRKQHLQKLETQVKTLDAARRQRRFWIDELAFINDARPKIGQTWFSSVETTFFPPEGEQPQQGGRPGRGGGMLVGGTGVTLTSGFAGIKPSDVGGPALTTTGQEPSKFVIPIPNGMIIRGFAESDEIINEYLKSLRTTYRQLPNNWFLSAGQVNLSEKSVQRVPWSYLYYPPSAGGQRQEATLQPGEPSLYTFVIEVKFMRSPERPSGVQGGGAA